MSLKEYILHNPTACYLMGRIRALQSTSRFIRQGILTSKNTFTEEWFRDEIRKSALTIRRHHQIYQTVYGGVK